MRLSVVASLTLLAAAAAVAAPLSKQTALKIMHERHEGMEAIGKANKVLRREISAEAPNVAEIRTSANAIAGLAAKSSHWFPQGTGPDVAKTGAKPEVGSTYKHSSWPEPWTAQGKRAPKYVIATIQSGKTWASLGTK